MTSFWRTTCSTVLIVCAMLLGAEAAYASHFRGGTLSHKYISGKTYELTLEVYFRRGSIGGCSGSKSCVGNSTNAGLLYTGDGKRITATVKVFFDNQKDIYGLRATYRHTYASANATYTAYWTGCCWVGSARGPLGTSWRLYTTLKTAAKNSSAVLNSPSLYQWCTKYPFSLNINASDPEGDKLTYSLVNHPSATTPTKNGMVIDQKGQITWAKPVAGSNWVISMVVTDTKGGITYREVMMIVSSACANRQPTIKVVPNKLTAAPNQKVCAVVTATDSDASNKFFVVPSPILTNSAVTPSDALLANRPNPHTFTYCWTPAVADAGKTVKVLFTAFDNGTPQLSAQTNLTITVSSNNKPVITGSPATTATENQPYNFKPGVTDADAGDKHTWTLKAGPTGTTIDKNTGEIKWTSKDADAGKSFTFTIEVCDDGKPIACVTKTWTTTVKNVNDPPKINGTPGTNATEDKAYAYNPTVTDPDPGDKHTWSFNKAPKGAKIDPNTGKITWTPGDADAGKTVDFEIKVCDAAGKCDVQSWKTTVKNVEEPPKITSVPPTSVLETKEYVYRAKATDPDPNEVLTWTLKSGPVGAKIDSKTGELTWQSKQSDAGKSYTFVVEVCDKTKRCVKQTFTVKVINTNDAPQINGKPPTNATEDQSYSYAPKVVDPDPGDSHTWKGTKLPKGAKLDPKTGKIDWIPGDADAGKTVDFEIEVCDKAGACAKQAWKTTVKNINDTPKITTTPSNSATEDSPYRYKPTAVDPDPNDTLTWKANKLPKGAKIDPTTGEITWTPGDDDAGKTVDFDLEVCDKAGACAKQAWKTTVKNVNDAPKITSKAPGNASKDNPLNYTPTAKDPDPNDTLTWKAKKIPTGASFDPSTGRIQWTPSQFDGGKDFEFEIEVCDKAGACDTQKFTIKVGKLQTPPQIAGLPENTAKTGQAYEYKPKVLDNDVGDEHTWKGTKLPPGATIDPKTGAIKWTPKASDAGKEFDFEIEVCDKSGLCAKQAWKVKATSSNSLPQIVGTPNSKGTEGQAYGYAPQVRDPDANDTHAWSGTKLPKGAKIDPKTGKIDWVPGPEHVGKEVEFEVKVCDSTGDCATQSWKVKVDTKPNTPPQITSVPKTDGAQGTTYTYKASFTDPDTSDTHTWTLKKGPSGSKIDPKTGELTWSPGAADADKESSFEIEVCDDKGNCATQAFKVRVGKGNNPPVLEGAPKTTASVNNPYNFQFQVKDPDKGDLHVWKGLKLPPGAKVDPSTGKLTWTPRPEDAGKIVEFEIQVCDNKGSCAVRKWKVKVDPRLNQPPTIAGTPNAKADVGKTYTYAPQVNDPDAGDTHNWTLKKGPKGAKLDPKTGQLLWLPQLLDDGKEVEFEVEVCDNKGACATQTFKVRVGKGNTPPTISGTPSTTASTGVPYGYKPVVNDPDPSATHTWKGNKLPPGAKLDPKTGELTWTPGPTDTGKVYDVELEVCDDKGSCATQSYKLQVAPKASSNVPPQIDGTPDNNAQAGQSYSYGPKVIDPDTGDTHAWKLNQGPASATIDPKTGQLNWTPKPEDKGKTVEFEVELCDSSGACAKQLWKVQVANDNQPPQITSAPSTKAQANKAYTYEAKVSDPDAGDTHSWKLSQGPAGAKIDAKTGKVTWTPSAGDNNTSSTFTVEVCDQAGSCVSQTFKVRVGAGNAPPTISGTPKANAEYNKAYTYQPKVNDPDAGDTHNWKLKDGPKGAKVDPKTGALSWTPGPNDVGKDFDFAIEVCDNKGDCAVQRFKVRVPENNQPQIDGAPGTTADASTPYNYSPTVKDDDPNDTHTWKGNQLPTGAKLDPKTGELDWTPKPEDKGKTFDVEVEVCDNKGGCAKRRWQIKVTGSPNTPPALVGTPSNDAYAGKTYSFNPQVSDPDVGDAHTWKGTKLPAGAKVDPKTGTLTWTPGTNDAGKDMEFEVEVCDKAGACAKRKWKVRVNKDNDAPRMTGTPETLASPLKPYSFAPGLENPVPGETYTWKGSKLPAGAKVDPKTGALTWNPTYADVGKVFDFELEVCDSKGKCSTRKWQVRVTTTDINTPPRITSTPDLQATAKQPFSYKAVAVDPDPGELLTWKLKNGPKGATIDPKTGEVKWTPDTSDAGKEASFELEVCDRKNRCDTQSFKIKPNAQNGVPQITSKAPEKAYVGQAVSYEPTATDPDAGDTLSWKLLSGPPGAKIDPSTGKLTWTPGTSDVGKEASFEIEVCDDGTPQRCSRQSFKLKVDKPCKLDLDCPSPQICAPDADGTKVCSAPGCLARKPQCGPKQFCDRGTCKPDLCENNTCASDEICRPSDGKCIKSCAGVKCQSGEMCVDGTCVADPCASVGKACKKGEVCDASDANNPVCVKDPCSDVACRYGRVCVAGQCVDDPCSKMTCPSDSRCVAGQCVDLQSCQIDLTCPDDQVCLKGKCRPSGCYPNNTQCQSGEICLQATCEQNECPTPNGQACKKGEFCRRGDNQCVASCGPVTCKKGTKCVDGQCEADPCDGVSCQSGEICIKGKCESNNCAGSNTCKHGRVCSTKTNTCNDDPCAGVVCPSDKEICRDGQCVFSACRFDLDCPGGELCVANQCLKPLCAKDDDCANSELCIDGKCVQDGCGSKPCDTGEFCKAGKCVKTCAGVFCSKGKLCIEGQCQEDPCADVTCQGNETCRNGKCVADGCQNLSTPCKQGRVCDVNRCIEHSCQGIKCESGQQCQQGQCVGSRQCKIDAECPGDTICASGSCTPAGCYKDKDCKDNQRCVDGTCQDDACTSKSCDQGSVCRPSDGKCVKSCPRCADGEICIDGKCEADPCDGVTCGAGKSCIEGTCQDDACTTADPSCRYGRTCSKGKCGNDICAGVTCPNDYTCREGSCYNNKAAPEVVEEKVANDAGANDRDPTKPRFFAGGGVGCSTQGGETPSPWFGLFFLLLVAGRFTRRRH